MQETTLQEILAIIGEKEVQIKTLQKQLQQAQQRIQELTKEVSGGD